MKAKVQYNDYVGTAAADISDYYMNSLNKYLQQSYPRFDWNRFHCVGCEFFASYGQYLTVRFICKDEETGCYRSMLPKEALTLEQFFNLFKRFSIVMGEGIESIELETEEDIVLS